VCGPRTQEPGRQITLLLYDKLFEGEFQVSNLEDCTAKQLTTNQIKLASYIKCYNPYKSRTCSNKNLVTRLLRIIFQYIGLLRTHS